MRSIKPVRIKAMRWSVVVLMLCSALFFAQKSKSGPKNSKKNKSSKVVAVDKKNSKLSKNKKKNKLKVFAKTTDSAQIAPRPVLDSLAEKKAKKDSLQKPEVQIEGTFLDRMESVANSEKAYYNLDGIDFIKEEFPDEFEEAEIRKQLPGPVLPVAGIEREQRLPE